MSKKSPIGNLVVSDCICTGEDATNVFKNALQLPCKHHVCSNYLCDYILNLEYDRNLSEYEKYINADTFYKCTICGITSNIEDVIRYFRQNLITTYSYYNYEPLWKIIENIGIIGLTLNISTTGEISLKFQSIMDYMAELRYTHKTIIAQSNNMVFLLEKSEKEKKVLTNLINKLKQDLERCVSENNSIIDKNINFRRAEINSEKIKNDNEKLLLENLRLKSENEKLKNKIKNKNQNTPQKQHIKQILTSTVSTQTTPTEFKEFSAQTKSAFTEEKEVQVQVEDNIKETEEISMQTIMTSTEEKETQVQVQNDIEEDENQHQNCDKCEHAINNGYMLIDPNEYDTMVNIINTYHQKLSYIHGTLLN